MHTSPARRRSMLTIRWLSILIFIMGVINISSGLFPAMHGRAKVLAEFISVDLQYGGRLTTVFTGFVMLLLVRYLSRRKYAAWLLTEWLLIISAVANLTKGFDFEEATIALVLFFLLLLFRSQFKAKSDPILLRQLPRNALISFIAIVLYGLVGLSVLDRHFKQPFSWWSSTRETVVAVTLFFDPNLTPVTRHGQQFLVSLYVLGAGWYTYIFLLVFAPVLTRDVVTPEERRRAQSIIEQYGQTPLAHFALFTDKHYFFSEGGSVLAYVVRSAVAMVLGDPIGPLADLPNAVHSFVQFAHDNDWTVALYQTRPETLDLYTHQLQWKYLTIGEEAIVDVSAFTLEGGEGKDFRYALNKLNNQGYSYEIVEPPLSMHLVLTLRRISDEWLRSKKAKEMRFSLGWFYDEYIASSQVMLVRDPEQQIIAFVTLVPEYQKHEVSLDLMRYGSSVPNGTMDYLFTALVSWAKESGYETFNLGLSPLAGVGDEKTDPVVEKALRFIFRHASTFYNFKGLHSFKEKFNPSWSPRYLVYQKNSQLPAIGLALLQVHQPSSLV